MACTYFYQLVSLKLKCFLLLLFFPAEKECSVVLSFKDDFPQEGENFVHGCSLNIVNIYTLCILMRVSECLKCVDMSEHFNTEYISTLL